MLLRLPDLDELAAEEEGRPVGDPGRLLGVVRHEDDRVFGLQPPEGLLDLRGRDRVEPRARLVEEDELRLQGQDPGDAEPLLLPAGELEGRGIQPVLDLVPEPRLFQAVLGRGP